MFISGSPPQIKQILNPQPNRVLSNHPRAVAARQAYRDKKRVQDPADYISCEWTVPMKGGIRLNTGILGLDSQNLLRQICKLFVT